MIKSMTGYGKANISKNLREYQIEIKSVNHRYLDVSVKMPRNLSYLEEEIKKIISEKLNRGKVDVFVTFNNNSLEGREIKINTEIARMYIKELRNLAESEGIIEDIPVTEISKLPDVLTIQTNQDDETIKNELKEVTQEAVENLIEMRRIEGEKISQDLQDRINDIEEKVKKISSLSTGLIEEYVVKLNTRIRELLQDQEIDEARLAQEVVIYADKCSIQEEVTRLHSHVYQFRELLHSNEAVGKKLDFMIQEMNRETNTIGSKANNLEITNEVINIKTQLENIREQVQNIE